MQRRPGLSGELSPAHRPQVLNNRIALFVGETLEGVPSFLELHANVVERGLRSLWDLHAAWYWKQLSLLGALDGGYNTYGFAIRLASS